MMVQTGVMTARRVALTFGATALFGITAVQAQNMMRGPSINIAPRAAVINPNMGPPVGAVAVGRVTPDVRTPSLTARSPCVRNFRICGPRRTSIPPAAAPARGSDGECVDVLADNGGGNGAIGKGKRQARVARAATMRCRQALLDCRPSPTRSSPRSTAR